MFRSTPARTHAVGAGASRARVQEAVAGWLFVLPVFLGIMVFEFGPFVGTLLLSFFDWDVVQAPRFVGLTNFKKLFFEDALYWTAVGNTVYFAVGTIVPGFFLSLFLAVGLNQRLKGVSIYRTLFYLPSITSIVAVAAVWSFVYNSNFGLINSVLAYANIPPVPWLGHPTWAMPSLIAMAVWKGVGYYMVLFLAGLQSIPEEYYEAAKIDGASAWRRFWHVTFPLLSPTSFFVLVLKVITAVQAFDAMYIMTQGGPAFSTYPLLFLMYEKAFVNLRMGYASAAGATLFLAVFGLTLFQLRLQRRWVHYDL